MKYRIIFALSLALGLGFLSDTASAQSSSTSAEGFRVGGLLGGGVVMNNDTTNNVNPMGFGLGVQGGYTFDFNLYLGADLRYFIGEKVTSGSPAFPGDFRTSTLQFTVDVGYDIEAARNLVLRPLIGLGVSHYKEKFTYGGSTTTNSDAGFLLSFGFEGIYDITDMFWVGGQIRFPLAFMGSTMNDVHFSNGGTDAAFQGMVVAGLHF